MKLILFILVILLAQLSEAKKKQQRCEYNYEYVKECEGWLKFHDIPRPWKEARLRCLYEGAQLASPTPELIDAMKDIIKKNDIPSEKVFTGIHATYSEWDFSSLEGTPLSRIPHKWAEDQPKGHGSCITVNHHTTLSQEACDSLYPFICYKKNKGLPLNRCGTTDNGYVMYNSTGSCYKFHRNPQVWSRAHMICEAEGGHLVIINSEVEAQIMKEILEEHPESSLLCTGYKDGAFVGFRDVDNLAEWVTVDGQTLSEAGFNIFGEGQPDNYGGDQHCGLINRLGVFEDVKCETFYPFICEKDRSSICEEEFQY